MAKSRRNRSHLTRDELKALVHQRASEMLLEDFIHKNIDKPSFTLSRLAEVIGYSKSTYLRGVVDELVREGKFVVREWAPYQGGAVPVKLYYTPEYEDVEFPF